MSSVHEKQHKVTNKTELQILYCKNLMAFNHWILEALICQTHSQKVIAKIFAAGVPHEVCLLLFFFFFVPAKLTQLKFAIGTLN